MDFFAELKARLGEYALSRGLFGLHAYALRVELAHGRIRLEQFITALDRARQLVDDLFGACPSVTAVVRVVLHDRWPDESRVLARLVELGVEIPADAPRRLRRLDPDDPDTSVAFEVAFPLSPSGPELLALLWCVCGSDHGIRPMQWLELYLVDLARALLFSPYDDRGADIVAATPEPLLPTWRLRNSWMLDYDRAEMAATFGPPEP